jgi:hypothetical protein
MGIEDAVVFAELAEMGLPLDTMLERFMARRQPRAELVVKNSRQLCEWEVTHQASPQMVGQMIHESQVALSEPF